MSDEESFVRLIFFAMTKLGLSRLESWLMPFGELIDYLSLYREEKGLSHRMPDTDIDRIIPEFL